MTIFLNFFDNCIKNFFICFKWFQIFLLIAMKIVLEHLLKLSKFGENGKNLKLF